MHSVIAVVKLFSRRSRFFTAKRGLHGDLAAADLQLCALCLDCLHELAVLDSGGIVEIRTRELLAEVRMLLVVGSAADGSQRLPTLRVLATGPS